MGSNPNAVTVDKAMRRVDGHTQLIHDIRVAGNWAVMRMDGHMQSIDEVSQQGRMVNHDVCTLFKRFDDIAHEPSIHDMTRRLTVIEDTLQPQLGVDVLQEQLGDMAVRTDDLCSQMRDIEVTHERNIQEVEETLGVVVSRTVLLREHAEHLAKVQKALEGDVESLEQSQIPIVKKLGHLEVIIERLSRSVPDTPSSEVLRDLRWEVEELHQQFTDVETRFESVEWAVSSLQDTRIDADFDFNEVRARVEGVCEASNKVSVMVTRLDELSPLPGQLLGIQGKLDTLHRQGLDVSQRLDQSHTEVMNAQSKADTVERSCTAMINQMQTKIEDMALQRSRQVPFPEELVAELKETVDGLQNGGGVLSDDVASLGREQDQLSARTGTIEQNQDLLKDQVERQTQMITELESRIESEQSRRHKVDAMLQDQGQRMLLMEQKMAQLVLGQGSMHRNVETELQDQRQRVSAIQQATPRISEPGASSKPAMVELISSFIQMAIIIIMGRTVEWISRLGELLGWRRTEPGEEQDGMNWVTKNLQTGRVCSLNLNEEHLHGHTDGKSIARECSAVKAGMWRGASWNMVSAAQTGFGSPLAVADYIPEEAKWGFMIAKLAAQKEECSECVDGALRTDESWVEHGAPNNVTPESQESVSGDVVCSRWDGDIGWDGTDRVHSDISVVKRRLEFSALSNGKGKDVFEPGPPLIEAETILMRGSDIVHQRWGERCFADKAAKNYIDSNDWIVDEALRHLGPVERSSFEDDACITNENLRINAATVQKPVTMDGCRRQHLEAIPDIDSIWWKQLYDVYQEQMGMHMAINSIDAQAVQAESAEIMTKVRMSQTDSDMTELQVQEQLLQYLSCDISRVTSAHSLGMEVNWNARCAVCGMSGHESKHCHMVVYNRDMATGRNREYLSIPILARIKICLGPGGLDDILGLVFKNGILKLCHEHPNAGIFLRVFMWMIDESERRELQAKPPNGSRDMGGDHGGHKGGGSYAGGGQSHSSEGLNGGNNLRGLHNGKDGNHKGWNSRSSSSIPVENHGHDDANISAAMTQIVPAVIVTPIVQTCLLTAAESGLGLIGSPPTRNPRSNSRSQETFTEMAGRLMEQHRLEFDAEQKATCDAGGVKQSNARKRVEGITVKTAIMGAGKSLFWNQYNQQMSLGEGAQASEASSMVALADWEILRNGASLIDTVTLGTVDNRYIRYIGAAIAPVEQLDAPLCFFNILDREMEHRGVSRSDIRQQLDQSRSDERLMTQIGDTKTWTIMLDEGAAITCISGSLVTQRGLVVKRDNRDLPITGFRQAVTGCKSFFDGVEYVVFILVLNGIRVETQLYATERILVVALVISELTFPMLLGANMITRHSIKDEDGDGGLSIFQGVKRMIMSKVLVNSSIVDSGTEIEIETNVYRAEEGSQPDGSLPDEDESQPDVKNRRKWIEDEADELLRTYSDNESDSDGEDGNGPGQGQRSQGQISVIRARNATRVVQQSNKAYKPSEGISKTQNRMVSSAVTTQEGFRVGYVVMDDTSHEWSNRPTYQYSKQCDLQPGIVRDAFEGLAGGHTKRVRSRAKYVLPNFTEMRKGSRAPAQGPIGAQREELGIELEGPGTEHGDDTDCEQVTKRIPPDKNTGTKSKRKLKKVTWSMDTLV